MVQVTPSPHGTKWGLGGTCVNVGCIPKKLMHHAGSLGAGVRRSGAQYGWNGDDDEKATPAAAQHHHWPTLVNTVQSQVRSLNFSYGVGLNNADDQQHGVELVRGRAYLSAAGDSNSSSNSTSTMPQGEAATQSASGLHEISFVTDAQPQEIQQLTADRVVLAVGGRPSVPSSIPGALELAITSDDLFSLKTAPKRTLVIGASYVALECAGFLAQLGMDVTVAIRSQALRGDAFDEQCVDKVLSLMRAAGVKFEWGVVPTRLERTDDCDSDGGIKVSLARYDAAGHAGLANDSAAPNDAAVDSVYDTVLFATGRRPDSVALGLEEAGVRILPDTGEVWIKQDGSYETSVPGIHCIGDAAASGHPELTPVAIRQGEILARRLCAALSPDRAGTGSSETGGQPPSASQAGRALADPLMVPATVFTPTEYGRVGLSEAAAERRYGADDIETYLMEWQSLESSAAGLSKEESSNLAKVVCVKSQNEKVVGFHYVGPHAGELLQGFSVAVNMGATKADLDFSCLGIHPTDAEACVGLTVTRASGQDFAVSGGCGGGRCG
jgi:pyruvate/2-oxoglutarate dehydrogenase complex dihydrolipoamide dehydrogenase (E3) component